MMRRLLDLVGEPRLRGVDVNSADLTYRHREILRQKPLIYAVMGELYAMCRQLDERWLSGNGQRIEIGAGSSVMKDFYPDVIVTDIKQAEFLDRVLDAQNMDLPDSSVRAFYGINCFHHLPSPDRFFSELERTLQPGGGCILVEPYYGPFAAFLYKHLFTTEGFDPEASSWEGDAERGAMMDANQALSYVVFQRDHAELQRKHPALERVAHERSRTYLRYLLSGGLNFRQLVPTRAGGALSAVERVLTPIDHLFALHHVIVLRKRA